MTNQENYQRTTGKEHWEDFKCTEQKEQLEPIPLVSLLIAIAGLAAGFSTVLYIAYLIMAALK